MSIHYDTFVRLVHKGIFMVTPENEVYRVRDRYRGMWREVEPRLFGYIGSDEYVRGVFKDEEGKAHDVILHVALWRLKYGALPEGKELNHRSGVRYDNRWANLELVDRAENIRHRDQVLKGRRRPDVENAYTRKRDWRSESQVLPPWVELDLLPTSERLFCELYREGHFRVYPDGRVVSVTFEGELDACRLVTQRKGSHVRQSWRVFFTAGGRLRSVQAHRMVRLICAEMVPARAIMNHLDGNPLNNAIGNLEVTDHQGNHAHRVCVLGRQSRGVACHQTRLRPEEVVIIWKLLKQGRVRQGALASIFGVTPAAISRIKRGQVWPDVLRPLERAFREAGNSLLTLTPEEDAFVRAPRVPQNRANIAPRGSDAGAAVLDDSAVAIIWWLLRLRYSQTAIGRHFGVGNGCIHAIASRKNWRWLTDSLEREYGETGRAPLAVDSSRLEAAIRELNARRRSKG